MTTPKLPLYFAPLQGYTEAPYRNAHAAVFGGIDGYFTPFVRLEKGHFRTKDVRDILPDNNQVPHITPQLLANTAEKAEKILALFQEHDYKEADINIGCPFPMLAKRHNGSGILPFPDEVKQLLEIVNKHPEVKFSVKMRLGWDDPAECMALLPLLNELPLTHITMHPRIGKQQYKGEVDLEAFAAFGEECRHPLIYNGDILTVEDIERIQEEFPHVAGVMIGRGLLMNPALALEYKTGEELSREDVIERLKTMHTDLLNHYEERMEGGGIQVLNKLKPFWEYPEELIGRKTWKAIKKSINMDKYRAALRQGGLL